MAAGSSSIRWKLRASNALAASMGWLTRAPGSLRILAFHDINDDPDDVFAVSERQFSDFLSLLRDEGYVSLRAADVLGSWPSVLERDRAVVLTFDDGYARQREVVAEALARRGMTATFFVLSSFLGDRRMSRPFDGKPRTFLSVEDLRWMEAAGFEIGSHSHTHPLCARLPEDRLEEELRVSKQVLENALGHPLTSFAYPYGRQRAFSSATRMALQRAGYRLAFTLESTRITAHSDLLQLPRTGIDRLDGMPTFRRKLEGHYDLLGNVRRYGGPDRPVPAVRGAPSASPRD